MFPIVLAVLWLWAAVITLFVLWQASERELGILPCLFMMVAWFLVSMGGFSVEYVDYSSGLENTADPLSIMAGFSLMCVSLVLVFYSVFIGPVSKLAKGGM